MNLLHTSSSRFVARRAFTIIEIAICLGIIGFALVAIIAVLPRGLDVQKRNRQETIIGQDADVWMSALRGGARGFDDLTNYVMVISNLWTDYDDKFKVLRSGADYYTPTSSVVTSLVPSPTAFPLTNGANIIGLLSMPKRIHPSDFTPALDPPPYRSNYVIAYVRAFSGAVVDKPPQTNSTLLSDSFTYRMIVETFPYTPIDTNAICMSCPAANGLTDDQLVARTNLLRSLELLQGNSHDFRLRFRWPVLPNGQIPNYGLATFRSLVDGYMTNVVNDNQPLYFVQSSTFRTNHP